jgi:hypothetical protein
MLVILLRSIEPGEFFEAGGFLSLLAVPRVKFDVSFRRASLLPMISRSRSCLDFFLSA